MREQIKRAEGSVQGVTALPEDVRHLFRTAWELPQRALIELATARQPFIDQSQSLNLFQASPTIGKLSSMYLFAWKSGLKTTHYLRSRPATRIQQATTSVTGTAAGTTAYAGQPTTATASPDAALTITDEAAVACSLENPETCEACE